MRELPILFSTDMVRAILDGRKTMTRRIIKFYGRTPIDMGRELFYKTVNGLNNKIGLFAGFYKDSDVFMCEGEQLVDAVYFKSPYLVGDILWVRETTWISECKRYIAQGLERGHSSKLDIINLETGKRYIWQDNGRGDYALTDAMITSWSWEGRYLRNNRQTPDFGVGFADVDTTIKIVPFSGNIILEKHEAQFRKKLPSIFMPKEAARIWLEVTDVRVERLQEITEEDAVKEGVKAYGQNNCSGTSARIAFAELWDSISETKFEWRANPWVWVYGLKRLEGYR